MDKIRNLFCLLVFITLVFTSCNQDIPDGMGKVTIHNEITDTCYVAKVWSMASGDTSWTLEWDDGDEYYNREFIKVYKEPGEYYFRVRVYYFDSIPMDYYSGLFSTANVEEGENSYLYFDGFSLHE